jgi:hypothetical protein
LYSRNQPLNIQALDPRTQTKLDKNLNCYAIINYYVRVNMADIRTQIDEGQEKWASGIDAQSKDIDIKEISDFVKFKVLEYDGD